MEVTLGADVVVDIATKEDLDRHHERLDRLVGARPRGEYYRIYGSGATSTGFSGSGPTAFSFTPQGPPPGRRWKLEWLALFVGTSVAAAAVANLNASLMIGRSPLGPGAPMPLTIVPNITDAAVPGLAVPANVSVPDSMFVKPQDQLYVVLAGSGLAASTIYSAVAGVIDVEDTPESLFW